MRLDLIAAALLALLCTGCPGDTKTVASAKTGSATAKAKNPLAKSAAKPWAGTYRSEDMKVVFAAEGESLTGTITYQGSTFPLTGSATKQTVEGSFKSGDDAFEFSVTRVDGALHLVSAGDTHVLKPDAPINPLAKANPLAKVPSPKAKPVSRGELKRMARAGQRVPVNVAGRASERAMRGNAGGDSIDKGWGAKAGRTERGVPATDPAPPSRRPAAKQGRERWGQADFWAGETRRWVAYSDPSGLSIRLPRGWKAQPNPAAQAVFIVPTEDKYSSLAMVFFTQPTHKTIKKAHNPIAVAVALKRLSLSLQGFGFRSLGKRERVDIGRKLIVADGFRGTNPNTKGVVHGRVFLTDFRQGTYGLFFMSPDAKLLATDGEVIGRALISTLSFGKASAAPRRPAPARSPSRPAAAPGGARNPELVAEWVSSSGYSSPGFSMTSSTYLALRADGVCLLGSRSAGGTAGASLNSGSGRYEEKGRWSTKGAILSLKWDSGKSVDVKFALMEVWNPGVKDNLVWYPQGGGRVRWKKR
jgi:hypothetical protein